jgi:hypothetical protein
VDRSAGHSRPDCCDSRSAIELYRERIGNIHQKLPEVLRHTSIFVAGVAGFPVADA